MKVKRKLIDLLENKGFRENLVYFKTRHNIYIDLIYKDEHQIEVFKKTKTVKRCFIDKNKVVTCFYKKPKPKPDELSLEKRVQLLNNISLDQHYGLAFRIYGKDPRFT